MDAPRLVEGDRSVLRRIYSHDAYYERVKLLLRRCHPPGGYRLSYANVRRMATTASLPLFDTTVSCTLPLWM